MSVFFIILLVLSAKAIVIFHKLTKGNGLNVNVSKPAWQIKLKLSVCNLGKQIFMNWLTCACPVSEIA